jgi:hypothetical protein
VERDPVTRGAKSTADRYWAELVRARGTCQGCGSSRNLQAAHIIRRAYVGDPDRCPLRTNLDNGLALCHACHRKADEDPVEMLALINRTIGMDRYRELARFKTAPHRRWSEKDWVRERRRLRVLLNAAGNTEPEAS